MNTINTSYSPKPVGFWNPILQNIIKEKNLGGVEEAQQAPGISDLEKTSV